MANTNILLIDNGGIYVPSAASVPVVAGDTVSFATSDGTAVPLFFSPDAVSVLSPAPANPFQLAAGGSAAFAFTSSAPGAYSMFVGAAPEYYPVNTSQSLDLEIGGVVSGPSFGSTHAVTNPGS